MHHELTPEDLRFLPPDLAEPELLGFVEGAWFLISIHRNLSKR